MKKKDVRPLVGYSYPVRKEKIQEMQALKGGLLICGSLSKNREEALEAVRYCREQGIRILLGEMVGRGSLHRSPVFSDSELQEILHEAGDALLGVFGLGEAGGILYWPKYYTMNRAARTWKSLDNAEGPEDAHRKLVAYLKDYVDFQRRMTGGDIPLCIVDSSQILQYQKEAGADFFVHEMCPGNPLELLPAFRGMARAFHTVWGTHIAIGWYGGIRMDDMWMKRWRRTLYLAFLQGADMIYPESGHYTYQMDKWGHSQGNMYDRDHPKLLQSRRILREFYRFAMIHQRPSGGPEAPVAVAFGNNEGCPNLWNPYAWGQYENGPEWEAGPAEKGWRLLETLLHKENVFNETVMGGVSHSGNPAGGQFDIVPVNYADFSRYRVLIYIGWNNMTEEQYERLVSYVKNGGHLLIWLAHFNVFEKRSGLELFNGGDLTELCGIKVRGWKKTDVRGFKFVTDETVCPYDLPYWGTRHDPWWMGKSTPADLELSGGGASVLAGFSYHIREYESDVLSEPALIENRLGKGAVWTVAVAEHPGDDGLRPFAEALIRIVNAGERPEVDLVAPEQVRYGIYDTELDGISVKLFYLLNTETDCSTGVRFEAHGEVSTEFILGAGQFAVVFGVDGALIFPGSHNIRLYQILQEEGILRLEFYALEGAAVAVHDFSGKSRKILVNGGENFCSRRVEEDFAEYYAGDFLEEPDITQFPHHAPFVHISQKLQA